MRKITELLTEAAARAFATTPSLPLLRFRTGRIFASSSATELLPELSYTKKLPL